MALFQRRVRLPDPVTDWLDPGERPLSYADTDDGEVVVATSSGLWWPFEAGPRRMPWHLVDKATWQDDILTVTEAVIVDDVLLEDRAPVAARLATARDLPQTVRQRVQGSVVRSELVPVPGGAARLVGRRVAGRDGVAWYARLERGTVDTSDARSAVRLRLATLRAAWEID